MRYYEITLPLPVSVNASHDVGGGYFCRKTKKWRKQVTRSEEYRNWIDFAGAAWRNSFPGGIREKFKGRIRVDYLFIWRDRSPGAETSDIGNREKVLSDFLQHKFFENDSQIDEQHQYRRFIPESENCVIVRITEVPDNRRAGFPPMFKDHEAQFLPQKAFDFAGA